MVTVGVIGHTGRLGKHLIKILEKHPYAEIVYTESRGDGIKGKIKDPELLILNLPHHQSRAYLRRNNIGKKRIIDLSPDHRCDENWVYGLTNFNKDRIKYAKIVANPGCYATAILHALIPINGFLENIDIKAYSGVSGRPNTPVNKSKEIEEYSIGKRHYQVDEIEKYSGKKINSFEPHLVHALDTGIVAIIDAKIEPQQGLNHMFMHTIEDDFEIIKDQPKEITIEYLEEMLKDVKYTNDFKMYCHPNRDSITFISTLDNVMKGGVGHAVQNFNIMYGFPEMTGLT